MVGVPLWAQLVAEAAEAVVEAPGYVSSAGAGRVIDPYDYYGIPREEETLRELVEDVREELRQAQIEVGIEPFWAISRDVADLVRTVENFEARVDRIREGQVQALVGDYHALRKRVRRIDGEIKARLRLLREDDELMLVLAKWL